MWIIISFLLAKSGIGSSNMACGQVILTMNTCPVFAGVAPG
jgi:hypothetical protein